VAPARVTLRFLNLFDTELERVGLILRGPARDRWQSWQLHACAHRSKKEKLYLL